MYLLIPSSDEKNGPESDCSLDAGICGSLWDLPAPAEVKIFNWKNVLFWYIGSFVG